MERDDLPEEWPFLSQYFGPSPTTELAHDLKNLLTILAGCVHVLDTQVPPAATTTPHFSDIRCAIDCASEITSELLGLGHRRATRAPVIALNCAVANVSPMLGRFLGPGISFNLSLAAKADTVAVDPLDLERILFNLTLNARDAMWEGDGLSIETATVLRSMSGLRRPDRLGTFVRLTVADTGRGIPRTLHGKVFEPFYTTKRDAPGLGLSIVARTVERLNGHVHLESQAGLGTRVHVDLPLVPEPDAV
jgi:signal transduction histidine kinase